MSPTLMSFPTVRIVISAALLLIPFLCAAEGKRRGGDYYTSDLISARIAVGTVVDARKVSPDEIVNRRVALTPEDIQRELAEGISEIHRGASLTRVGGRGVDRALQLAREKGAQLLLIPTIEQFTIDPAGKNGLDPVAKIVDVVLFPVTLAEAAIYRGERAGLGAQYIPLHDLLITMKMTIDYHRVSDGARLLHQDAARTLDAKVNKDNIEGARFEAFDDWIDVGKKQGAFLVREYGREIARYEIAEILGQGGESR